MELQNIQISESRTSLSRDNSETMDTPQQYSFIGKLKRSFRLITVEPVVILYLFAVYMAGDALTNLRYEMACRVNLKLNDTVCSNWNLGYKHVSKLLYHSYQQNSKLQTFSILELNLSEILKPGSENSISSNTLSIIMLLCFATFSDQHKMRKTFIILPGLGGVFSCIGLILCAVFVSTWPVQRYFLMQLILPQFFGALRTLAMAVSSYVSDITTQEDRTFRIGIVHITSTLVILIAPLATGLFRIIGYYGIFCTSLSLFVVALIYGHVFLKEKSRPKLDCNLLFDVFNPKTVIVDMSNVLLEKRVACTRFLLIMSYVCYILIKGPMAVEQLYFRNYITQLARKKPEMQYVLSFTKILPIVGLFIGIILFAKKLKLNDYLIAIICCIVKIIVGVSDWCVSGSNLKFWFGPVLGIFNELFTVALRSVITKLVSPSEVAKSQALFGICDVLHPLIYSPIFAHIYSSIKHISTDAMLLLTPILIFIPFILLLVMNWRYKHYLKQPKPEEHSPDVQQNERDFVTQLVYALRLAEVEIPVTKNK